MSRDQGVGEVEVGEGGVREEEMGRGVEWGGVTEGGGVHRGDFRRRKVGGELLDRFRYHGCNELRIECARRRRVLLSV